MTDGISLVTCMVWPSTKCSSRAAGPNHGSMGCLVLRVTETVSDTHTSADFIAFLQKLDRAYPEHHQIRLVLGNHSAHISKETRGYLSTMPQRFVFVFTPKHGSWLNLIENQFSKMTRTMLRGIRVASKQELIDRIHQYFEEINEAPVVFRWKYKMDEITIV